MLAAKSTFQDQNTLNTPSGSSKAFSTIAQLGRCACPPPRSHRRREVTKKSSRVLVLVMTYRADEHSDPIGYSHPATALTGMPRTIRRHQLRHIAPLADRTIYEMEKRGEFPRRLNLTLRCVASDIVEIVAG